MGKLNLNRCVINADLNKLRVVFDQIGIGKSFYTCGQRMRTLTFRIQFSSMEEEVDQSQHSINISKSGLSMCACTLLQGSQV